ncbi:hypothetical protein K493DRAFT_299510 [Basidiobolus meristosporus CBS 931.73]|uniref:Uncharacterized protein n=1 Tax=Basidiobolus meristosporus CBS 931.73 TaxID=1314790 RepID=A0A1Y1YMC6_9FUNG|nr:hypothetical protein K493DRAFT_299510 [Basidiobolus meristosporus CBS 931.73]|eukprot:ORX99170.1 hypothetical protein K493DRAFT_299510 [Basidiobolus meristosporus CBS 931.73]
MPSLQLLLLCLLVVGSASAQKTNSTLPNTRECQTCMQNLPPGCVQSITTGTPESGSKCVCSNGYVNNFSSCGVCSQQYAGVSKTVIPTDADKQRLIKNCASDGASIANATGSATLSNSTSTSTSTTAISSTLSATTAPAARSPSVGRSPSASGATSVPTTTLASDGSSLTVLLGYLWVGPLVWTILAQSFE